MSVAEQIKAVTDKVVANPGTVVVFQNTIQHCRYTLKNGKDCIFLNGKYVTDLVPEIEELLNEIALGHANIFVDDKMLVTRESLDPMAQLREKIIADYKAQQAAIASGDSNFGSTTESKLNVASSANVAGAAAGSSSLDAGAGTAKIVAGPRV